MNLLADHGLPTSDHFVRKKGDDGLLSSDSHSEEMRLVCVLRKKFAPASRVTDSHFCSVKTIRLLATLVCMYLAAPCGLDDGKDSSSTRPRARTSTMATWVVYSGLANAIPLDAIHVPCKAFRATVPRIRVMCALLLHPWSLLERRISRTPWDGFDHVIPRLRHPRSSEIFPPRNHWTGTDAPPRWNHVMVRTGHVIHSPQTLGLCRRHGLQVSRKEAAGRSMDLPLLPEHACARCTAWTVRFDPVSNDSSIRRSCGPFP